MTETQLALAWGLVDEPILCFDGDAAGQRAAVRACLRALPLLAPGKSLRIATLPAGQDPDDLVKSGGPAAFEAVLAAAQPLVEHLWRSEIDGQDVTTPERRALVRQRLRGHAEAIADPSVKSLYQAEFNARFDAVFLARPERARGNWAPAGRFAAPLAGASPALKARTAASQSASPEMTAILAGLLIHPALADRHAETLAALPISDPRQQRLRDAIVSALAMSPDLESDGLRHNLERLEMGELAEGIRQSNRANRLQFSFTRAETQLPVAMRDFGAVVEAIAARARIEAELAVVTSRFRASLAEADFALQRDLLAERVEVDAAIMRLAESLRDS
jgi:DNA primase